MKGLTLKEMARLVGVSETSVQKWKHGGFIAYETLQRLAVVLNTTCDSLLSGVAPASAYAVHPENPKDVSLTREAQKPYGVGVDVCRYPEGCDLSSEISGVKDRLANIERLLLSLLAEERGKHTAAPPATKAG